MAMEDLRDTAYAYYEAGKENLEEPVKLFFEEMDHDRDEKIGFEEFKSYMKTVDCTKFGTKYFFDELRGGKEEYLLYRDVVTLLYIIHSGRPFCEKCKRFIKGTYFTCVKCFETEGDYSFNVCPSCFYARSYHHCHEELMDPFVMLRLKKKQDQSKEESTSLHYTKVQPSASNPVISSSHAAETSTGSSNAMVVGAPNPRRRPVIKPDRALQFMQFAVGLGNLLVASQLCTIM